MGSLVLVRSAAPRRGKRHIACPDFFQKSGRAHFAAPPSREKSRLLRLRACKRARNASAALPIRKKPRSARCRYQFFAGLRLAALEIHFISPLQGNVERSRLLKSG